VGCDPVAIGLVPSLAHLGGNIIGVTSDVGFQLYEKWIELLKELVPKLTSIFFLSSTPNWEGAQHSAILEPFRAAAKRAGTPLIPILLGSTFNEEAYERAFKSMDKERAEALMFSAEVEHFGYRAALVRLVAERRLPAMWPVRNYVEIGGLMTYSNDPADTWRRLAAVTADILKGKRPQDIPVSQPTKFELVINLKTAKSQGIDVPPTLLARADEVIE
jgi:putative tryptophan/tyrosine transport system substrate-binding protein